MTQRWVVIAKIVLWALCLAPLGLLVLQAFGYAGGLGANDVEKVRDVCGKTGLNLLMLTLCVTPVRRWTGVNRLITFRRPLGLFAFFYVSLHFLTYALLEAGLLFQPQLAAQTLLADIAERPYITVGFTAFVLLIPLAATSTRALQRRLGRNWAKLHRLVYVIAIAGVVHYYWQIKADLDFVQPLIYASLLAVLLGVRLRHRLVHSKAAMAPADRGVEPPPARDKAAH